MMGRDHKNLPVKVLFGTFESKRGPACFAGAGEPQWQIILVVDNF